ncbi:unnamed protein product [Lactuca saligna]|uniref:Uncharacterized protein n=1 Tax=Lactuca saligna TaxID=75948 RepID=A0AA35Z4U3_LACSI|nr:unnamed protein product [Lactuca saligna]
MGFDTMGIIFRFVFGNQFIDLHFNTYEQSKGSASSSDRGKRKQIGSNIDIGVADEIARRGGHRPPVTISEGKEAATSLGCFSDLTKITNGNGRSGNSQWGVGGAYLTNGRDGVEVAVGVSDEPFVACSSSLAAFRATEKVPM